MVVLNEVALNNIEVLSNLKNDEIKFNGLWIKSNDDKDEDYKQVDNLSEIEYIIYFTFHQLILYIQKNNDKQKINKLDLIEKMDTAVYNIYLYFKFDDCGNIIKILNQIEELLYIIENDNKYSLFSKFNIYMIYFINPIIDLVSDLKQKYKLYYNFYNYVCYKDNLDALNELLNDITSDEEEEDEQSEGEDISDLEDNEGEEGEEDNEGEGGEEGEEGGGEEGEEGEEDNEEGDEGDEVDDTLEIIEKEEEDTMEDTDVSDKTWTPGIFRYAFYVPPTSIK